MKYQITINILLLKLSSYWDAVSEYHFGEDYIFEEWHIENSNYANYMDGFCLWERTPKNHCRFANITKTFIPNDKLALLGDTIINQLEKLSNQNTEKMMINVKKYIINKKLNV